VLPIAHIGVQLLLINNGVIGGCGARFWNGIGRYCFVFEIVVVGQIGNIQS
jgi:hypothetical protein